MYLSRNEKTQTGSPSYPQLPALAPALFWDCVHARSVGAHAAVSQPVTGGAEAAALTSLGGSAATMSTSDKRLRLMAPARNRDQHHRVLLLLLLLLNP